MAIEFSIGNEHTNKNIKRLQWAEGLPASWTLNSHYVSYRTMTTSVEELVAKCFPEFYTVLKNYEDKALDSWFLVSRNQEFWVSLHFDHDSNQVNLMMDFVVAPESVPGDNNEELARRYVDAFTDLTTKQPTTGRVYMMAMNNGSLSFMSLPKPVFNPLIPENYSEEVLRGVQRVKADLDRSTPTGRIAIFDGPPGTGKTHLVKALLTECTNSVFIMLAPDLMSEIVGPNALLPLINFANGHEGKNLVFLVEDADECIAPRDSGNRSLVSSVLNLGDGIVGQILDIRLVMTTNAKRPDIDPAIARPGRLSALIKVDKLSAEQCNEIYARLMGVEGGDIFDRPATLAEVYSKASGNGWVPPTTNSNPIGFQTVGAVPGGAKDFTNEHPQLTR